MADNPIRAALAKLDPMEDAHWTDDGLPRLDAVAAALGAESVQRKAVTDAAPGFNRDKAIDAATNPAPVVDAPRTGGTEPGDEPATHEIASRPDCAPEGDPEILLMPMPQVMGDIDLLERAMAELDRQEQALLAERAELNKRIEELQGKSDVVKRQHSRLWKADPNRRIEQVRAVQAAHFRVSAERQRRTEEVLGGPDAAKRLREALNAGTSPLDAALKSRPNQAAGRSHAGAWR